MCELLVAVQDLIRSRMKSYGPLLGEIRMLLHARPDEANEASAQFDVLPRHGIDSERRLLTIEYASRSLHRLFAVDHRVGREEAVRRMLDEVSWALRLARVTVAGAGGFDVEAMLEDVEALRMDLPVADSGVQAMLDAARRSGDDEDDGGRDGTAL